MKDAKLEAKDFSRDDLMQSEAEGSKMAELDEIQSSTAGSEEHSFGLEASNSTD